MSLELILKDRKFWPLYWTQFFGALNDNFLKNAMVILVEYKGLAVMGLDSASIVALAGGIFILPFFLFSMLAGQISDKYEKSQLVVYVKFWELLITLVASCGFYFHSIVLLLSALFMMGLHSTFFGPVKYSAIPELVAPDKLMAANAYVELGTFLAILVGTIGGGVMIQMPHGELVISLALNVCALVGIWTATRLPKLHSSSRELKIRWNPFTPIFDTVRILRQRIEVFYSILAISWFWFFGASLLSILPPYCKEYLHAEGHVMTAFLAMWTFGVGLGTVVCEKLSFKKIDLGMVPVGTIGITLFMLDLSRGVPDIEIPDHLIQLSEFIVSPYGPRLLFDFFMLSVFCGFFILPLYTVMQERSEKAFRSRVIAGNNVFNAVFMVSSALIIIGLHMLHVSIPRTFFYLTIANVLFSGFIYLMVPEFLQRMVAWVKERRFSSGS